MDFSRDTNYNYLGKNRPGAAHELQAYMSGGQWHKAGMVDIGQCMLGVRRDFLKQVIPSIFWRICFTSYIFVNCANRNTSGQPFLLLKTQTDNPAKP